jgi:hypothetical protein
VWKTVKNAKSIIDNPIKKSGIFRSFGRVLSVIVIKMQKILTPKIQQIFARKGPVLSFQNEISVRIDKIIEMRIRA